MFPAKGYAIDKVCRDHSIFEYSEEEKTRLLKRLKDIGSERTKRVISNIWIEKDSDGFTGWRWEKYHKQLLIVSAANRYGDIVVTGPRHSSPTMVYAEAAFGGLHILHEYGGDDCEQGFVDQYDVFHTREEALIIATKAGQVRYPSNNTLTQLFSEGLY